MQHAPITQTSPTAPVSPANGPKPKRKAAVRLVPERPPIKARHTHRQLSPRKRNFPFDMSRVMDEVQAVLIEPDPEAALAERLCAIQAAEQARFVALPDTLKSDDGALLRHEHQLRTHQATHDAALKVLRLMSAWIP